MIRRPFAIVLFTLAAAACGDSGAEPELGTSIEFSSNALALGEQRSGTLVIRNTGQRAVGPIEIAAGAVERAGLEIPGVGVIVTPSEIPTLNPGDSAIIQLEIDAAAPLQSGTYQAELAAMVQNRRAAQSGLSFLVPVPGELVGGVSIAVGATSVRQGDVAPYSAVVVDTLGNVLPDATVTWEVEPGIGGLFDAQGRFVPYTTGPLAVIAHAGSFTDTLHIDVQPRGLTGSFTLTGHASMHRRFTSDLWIFDDVAYTGTWGNRNGAPGNAMYVWRLDSPDPSLVDSIRVVATTVNDVKIRADGQLAVITHERPGTVNYGITVLGLADRQHPQVLGTFEAPAGHWIGIHNVWIEGDYVYAVVDNSGTGRGLWIFDISDPTQPQHVSQYYGGTSFLHDVYVRDGIAFLSHWDAGLILLDVGNGVKGGTPLNPVEIGKVQTHGGQTHNAWYWPARDYVFVGEEDFGTPGIMHVVDVSDPANPVEVASFRSPGDTPHNFWLDEAGEVLYMAWYTNGLIALDVSGQLMGSLERQGRVIAQHRYDGIAGCPGGGTGTCTWAPQLHNGQVFVSDMNSGIWVFDPAF